jgi:hypothetical protein
MVNPSNVRPGQESESAGESGGIAQRGGSAA